MSKILLTIGLLVVIFVFACIAVIVQAFITMIIGEVALLIIVLILLSIGIYKYIIPEIKK